MHCWSGDFARYREIIIIDGTMSVNANSEINSELSSRLGKMEPVLSEVSNVVRYLQERDLSMTTKRNDLDLVTNADLESERILTESIREYFPEDQILAEESGWNFENYDESKLTWVLDPIDGTINYAHRLPLYSVSIGLMLNKKPVAGLVGMPALGTVYRAIENAGATCNGQPIHVSQEDSLSHSLIVTGFPYNRSEVMESLMKGIEIMLRNARGLRRTGSACLDLCWLAEGRFEGYYELNLSPWDTCAASIIAREAGAKITGFDGHRHSPFTQELIASNGLIHEMFLNLLKPVFSYADK